MSSTLARGKESDEGRDGWMKRTVDNALGRVDELALARTRSKKARRKGITRHTFVTFLSFFLT
jgi:hypothetical protein